MTTLAERIAELAEVDALPADLRAIVHDGGYSAVRGFLQLGIRDAACDRLRSGRRARVDRSDTGRRESWVLT